MDEGVSIAMPTYGYRGHGAEFLDFSLKKLSSQTFPNFEVVISDDSTDDSIYNVTKKFPNLDIKYHKSRDIELPDRQYKKGMTPNLNRALKQCNREMIQILFQDDFVYDQFSLQKIYTKFKSTNSKWLACAFYCTKDGYNMHRSQIPQYHDEIYLGVNTMSSPSIVSILNNDIILFDEDLIMLMDCDFYKSMAIKFGLPTILDYFAIAIRQHSHQISTNEGTEEGLMDREVQHVKKKYEHV